MKMSHQQGDLVEYDGNDAVVTHAESGSYDVAVASDATGGRCRRMHLNVDGEQLSDRSESEEE